MWETGGRGAPGGRWERTGPHSCLAGVGWQGTPRTKGPDRVTDVGLLLCRPTTQRDIHCSKKRRERGGVPLGGLRARLSQVHQMGSGHATPPVRNRRRVQPASASPKAVRGTRLASKLPPRNLGSGGAQGPTKPPMGVRLKHQGVGPGRRTLIVQKHLTPSCLRLCPLANSFPPTNCLPP